MARAKFIVSGKAALLLAGLPLAFVGLIGGLLLYFARMAPGDEIASVTAQPGQPFELSYVSTGEAERVWLDIVCQFCDPNSVEGRVTASTEAGRQLASAQVEEPTRGFAERGSSDRRQDRHEAFGHPFMDVPAEPPGTRVIIRGTLVPQQRTGYKLGPIRINDDRVPPTILSLRVWVAP